MFSLTASAESYVYTPGDTSLGNGAVEITYAEGTTDIATLVATPSDGGAITLTGGAATFAADATLTLATSGTVAFAEKVTAKGALTLARGDNAYRVWTGTTPLSYSYQPGTCVAENDTIANYDCIHVVAGIPGSDHRNVAGRYDAISGSMGGSNFVLLNRVADAFVYSIRVQIWDENGHIYARCRTGVRSPRFGLHPDVEDSWAARDLWGSMTTVGKSERGIYGQYSGDATDGATWLGVIDNMGLNRIIFRRKGAVGGPMKVRFDGGVALGGTTTVPFGMEAVVGVDGGSGPTTVSGTITGAGDVTFVPMATTAPAGTGRYIDGFITSTNWVVLAENRSLAAMTSVEGYMQGGSHTDVSKCTTYFYRFNPADNTATCQFHFRRTNPTNPPNPAGATTKYVVAKFRQNGANVEICAVGYGYANPGIAGTEFPTKKETTSNYTITSWSTTMPILIDPDGGYVSSNMTTGYGLRRVTATFGNGQTNAFATMSGDITTLYGGKVTMASNVNVTVTSLTGLPAGGEAHVSNGAYLSLQAPGDAAGGGTTRIVVHSGGEVSNVNTWQVGSNQDVVLDGGTFNGANYTCYLNFLTLSNALMTGNSPRFAAFTANQLLSVVGTEPSILDCNLGANVYGSSGPNTSNTFRMNVRDVTGDSDPDCILSRIQSARDRAASDREPYAWFWFEKYGTGTLKISEDSTAVRLETRLFGGTLLLAGSDIMTNDVVLAGGSLAVDAGKSNSLGRLTANKPGMLTVGAGGSLTFASFTNDVALAAKSVTIDAPLEGNVLRFGSDLTYVQRRIFRWKDAEDGEKFYHVYQDAEGYIHPNTLGGRLIVR